MVKAKFFGTARAQFGEKEIDVDAASVNDLLEITAARFGVTVKDMKQFLVYVNDVGITKLKMWRTKLEDGDVVMFLSPASGG